LKEHNDRENHNDGRCDCCNGCSQNGPSHMNQGVLGTFTAVDASRQTGIGVRKVGDKVSAQTNQNSKTLL
jgi:hypothetical protein